MEWAAIPFSRGIFLTQGSNLDLLRCRQIFHRATREGLLLKWKKLKKLIEEMYMPVGLRK